MIDLTKYCASDKENWDNLVKCSKSDTFLFYRNFMDYHADRFRDCSFLIYQNNNLEAVLPGNISKNIFYSHQGLTYGGLVLSKKLSTKDILIIFDLLNIELRKIGIEQVIYKPIPFLYQSIPSQEEIYALFRNKAEKIGCNISSAIYQQNKIEFTESRKSGIRKSKREGIKIVESDDFKNFWQILDENLQNKHFTMPVHSVTEIIQLKKLFPENIRLFVAQIGNKLIGGTVLFVMKNIIHVQYISASDLGKKMGALDLLFDELINRRFIDYSYFDFGQSTEEMGNYLNKNLIFQKEGFGGRGVVYDIYKYQIA